MAEALIVAAFVTAIGTPVVLALLALWRSLFQRKNVAASEGVVDSIDTSEAEVEKDPPVHHEVPIDISEFVIPNFRPGMDTCRIHVRDSDIEFKHGIASIGVIVEITDASERLSITFQGLSGLPSADLSLLVSGQSGHGAELKLEDVVDLDGAIEAVESASDEEWHVAAWAETERALEAQDGVLQKWSGLVSSHPVIEFADFDAAVECIEIWVPTEDDLSATIDVQSTADQRDGIVVVDGRVTALLKGAPNASEDNVRLVPVAKGANSQVAA